MHHWDRDTSGRLQRISTPVEQGCEISVHSEQMDPLPEEQQSQQAPPMNPTAYRSMRDHIHPLRVSAPSCIIPPAEDVTVRPYLVPLLLTFHGMENENPYSHIRDFEEVCITFKEGITDMELLKLKAFLLTLKDKAKIWLNSLRPRTIRNWGDLQAEFLKKFFNTTKTNGLKRQIYTYSAYDNEKFYQCWERYMETINACPHHGFDTWMLVNHFYDGMSPAMKQLLETMCGGDFLNYVAETSKAWDEPNPREAERSRPSNHQRGGIYALSEDTEMKGKLTTLTRRLEELEMRSQHEMQAVNELPASQPSYFNGQSNSHLREHCQEHAHVLGQNKPPTNAPYGNTYNPNCRNHPNLSWKPKPPAYIPTGAQQQFGSTSTQQQPPPSSSSVEQAILNLSKVVGTFVEEHKVLNIQTNQKIEAVESSLNRKMDSMHSEISRLSNQQLQSSEKEKSLSQTLQNQKGVHEIGSTNDPKVRIYEVKAVVTLRSGKELRPAVPVLANAAPTVTNPPEEEQSAKREGVKTNVPLPFPQALRKKKNYVNHTEMLEVLRQVKVNIPLIDMIKQVPTYAKFLKDLCTVKRGLNVNKKAFLTEQVSAIIECKTPVKYKDPGCPTISVNIGGISIEKALLDLGASVNLLPYSMYKQLGLGELKPTSITLSLTDRSIKIPKGTIEDVLIQVDRFYYLVDFVVLDTEPVAVGANHVPIILGRPFLATSNAIINCRNGVMQLTFGNMTLELNIFHLSKRHMHSEEDNCEEVCIIETILEEQANEDVLTPELSECLGEQQEPQSMSLVQGYWKKK